MVRNFISLFEQNQTLQIKKFCEPFLKQLFPSPETLDVDEYLKGEDQIGFEINLLDFEFLQLVAIHDRCQAPLAMQVLDFVLEIACRNIIFAEICF